MTSDEKNVALGIGSRTANHGLRIRGLYAIADSVFNPCASLSELARRFLDGGCRIVQLRMKNSVNRGSGSEVRGLAVDGAAVLAEARAIARLKAEYDFTFIVNDHADVAAEVGADGVHVGENDAPVAAIKSKYGDRLIVGYSSHSLEEARRAVECGADYVALGAIFPTKTKGPGHPVQGLAKLSELVRSIDVPVVAIGGIGRGNVGDVIAAGASSVAMITALSEAEDIAAEARWFEGCFCAR